jgi:hypothetical protein
MAHSSPRVDVVIGLMVSTGRFARHGLKRKT